MNALPPKLPQSDSSRALLDEAYQSLDYRTGALLNAIGHPEPNSVEAAEWVEKGDWLALATKVGAEKIFFVKNDPVIVFHRFPSIPSDEELLRTFQQTWCMARPKCLFIALPGELRTYPLNRPPARTVEEWREIEPLDVARSLADVAERLHAYRREEVETGHLFADQRFANAEQGADKLLIQDLKIIRSELVRPPSELLRTPLDPHYAHALIGRSLFIRYLEDRGVLTPAYFERVAAGVPRWKRLLAEEPEKLDLTPNGMDRRYDRVLRDKEFTYAVFRQLADDFNGDMFPRDLKEEEVVGVAHLMLLRGFILGDTKPTQPKLFFWAYDFKIIPIELISSIYEEFYHKKSVDDDRIADDKGTHYTPSVLVNFVLSQVLTPARLATKPKILDPACGSGIFLVEAFRRIVRYQAQHLMRSLSADELRRILHDQLTGIEINLEAARVAAFSLYLALLNYQEPPDILASKRLPNLVYNHALPEGDLHYRTIINADAFWLTQIERDQHKARLREVPRLKGRATVESLLKSAGVLPLEPASYDIVVGNPPWGFTGGATPQIKEAQRQAQLWCDSSAWVIGDRELSQAFIARILSLLSATGACGLLISTGVFFKHHEKSKQFRHRWLTACTINAVVNFAHVRHLFFTADAPFAFVHFQASPPLPGNVFEYWSAKRSKFVNGVQAVILSGSDLHRVNQDDVLDNDYLWKIYWWGSHRDAALITALNLNMKLADSVRERGWQSGRGFQGPVPSDDENVPSGWLSDYKELPTSRFQRYGPVVQSQLSAVPARVHRLGVRAMYDGWRLLVKRGITQKGGANGRIESRLEDSRYCFRNSIHAIKIENVEDWERKALIGLLWSSLGLVTKQPIHLCARDWHSARKKGEPDG